MCDFCILKLIKDKIEMLLTCLPFLFFILFGFVRGENQVDCLLSEVTGNLKRSDSDIHAAVTFWCSQEGQKTEAIQLYGHICDWDTSSITSMKELFGKQSSSPCSKFDEDISKWDTSKVTNMEAMFYNAESFNGDISKWDTSQVTNMGSMFFNAKSFNGNISKWDISKVTNMGSMFYNAESFNGNISKWDTSKVTNMGYMFFQAVSFNRDISKWDTSKVTIMQAMFFSAESFNRDISKWDTSKVFSFALMFNNCPISDNYKPKRLGGNGRVMNDGSRIV